MKIAHSLNRELLSTLFAGRTKSGWWNNLGPLLIPLLLFTIFLLVVGVNPLEAYVIMFQSVTMDFYGIGEVFVKATPFILTALAAALPAKAGLINVGGEGQLAFGALFTAWVALFYLSSAPGWIGIPLILLAGALGGAVWACITAFLKVRGNMNETITSLLLNYVAIFFLGYVTHGALKDPASFNWPFSPPMPDQLRLVPFLDTRVTVGILISLAAAVFVWYLVDRTRLGYRIKVIGGNAEAARQAGIPVKRMHFWVLIGAGSLAGLAGAIELAGVEERLRETTGMGYGYLGFLASWMAWNHPLRLIGTAFVIGFITVTGSSLEINTGLPSSSVKILMAFVLFSILALGRRKSA